MTRALERLAIRSDLCELEPLFSFLAAFCGRHRLGADACHSLSLVVEELAVNAIEHGYVGRSDGTVEIALKPNAGSVEIWVTDGAPPFDPLSASDEPDIVAGIDDRPIGGLGVHLVKALTLRRSYRFEGGKNIVWAELATSGE